MQSLRQQKTNLKEKENLTKSDIKQTSNLRPSTTKNNIKKETLNKGSKIDEKKTLKTDININQEDEDIVCEKKEQQEPVKKKKKEGKKEGKKEPKSEFSIEKNPEQYQMVSQKYNMNPISIKKFPGGYESESYVVKLKDVKYVLKFQRLSTHHHLTLEHYKIQNEVLLHLEKQKQKYKPEDSISYPQIILTAQKEPVFLYSINKQKYYIKMLNFVEGRDIKGEEYHPLRNRIMRAVGIMHRDLENFTFESKEKINHTHYLNNIYPQNQRNKIISFVIKRLKSKDFILAKQCPQTIKRFKKQRIFLFDYLKLYQTKLKGLLSQVRRSVIHNDLHPGNILTNEEGTEVTSIIDYGWNLRKQYFFKDIEYVFDVWFHYHENCHENLLDNICEMICSYHQYHPLTQKQIQCLYLIIGTSVLKHKREKAKWQFLKIDPKVFIMKLKKVCKIVSKEDVVEKPSKQKILPLDKTNFLSSKLWETVFKQLKEENAENQDKLKKYLSKRWIEQDMEDLFIEWTKKIVQNEKQSLI